MKKLTVLFAAVIMALTSYAACNEYGWTNGTDMFTAFVTDYNTFAGAGLDVEACVTTAGTFYDVTYGKTPAVEAMFVDAAYSAKWGWLLTFLTDQCRAFQGKEPDMTASMMRGAIDNFFHKGALNSTAWNKSYDATEKGNVEDFMSWQSYWNNSWCVKEVCNDYGWANKGDMFLELQSEINDSLVAHSKYALNVVKKENDSVFYFAGGVWKYWEDVEAANTPVENANGDFAASTYNKQDEIYSILRTEKWSWLLEVIKENYKNGREDHADFDETYAILIRCNIQAFFFNSPTFKGGDSNPWSFDYTEAGKFINWQSKWGQKFCTGSATVTVTYDLQGGVTNDYGWANGEDMYKDFVADFNVYAGSEIVKEFGPSTFYDPTYALPADKTVPGFFADATYNAKWGWLYTYLCVKVGENYGADQATGETKMGTASIARGAVDNFFNNGKLNSGAWNKSFDADVAGGIADVMAWQANWKHGFANPTEFAADLEFDLATPYKEGESFRGWFLDALGQGQEVKKMSSVYDGQTIYAVFGAYQPTIKEIRDTTLYKIGDEITTTAIVTAVSGKNVYIADASGMGILAYYSASQQDAIQAGQKLTVKGVYDVYNGFPELKNCETKALVDGEAIGATTISISDILAAPLKVYGLPVLVKDIRVAKYDDKGNLYVTDGVNVVEAYYICPDQTEFPVGQRINLTAVVGNYKETVQFVGTVAGVEKIVFEAKKDPNTYADLQFTDENNETYTYSIKSDWIFSAQVGNWESNKPAAALEQCRGMVVKDGIIYMTWRSSNSPADALKLIRYDAATGEKLTDLILANYIFRQPAADTTDNPRWYLDEGTGLTYVKEDYEWNYAEFTSADYTFGPNTGLAMDDAGHLLVADLPTSGTEYQIWMIDEKTGEGQLVIYCGGNSGASTLKERYADDGEIRFDRFDVAGDVTKDATIFTMNKNSDKVYTFDIYGGKWDGDMWQTAVGGGTIASFGEAPQINPVDGGESFYCSGSGLYPTLASAEDGTILESFNGVFDEEENPIREECLTLIKDTALNTAAKVAGCREFKVGGAYFFSMSAATWEGGYKPYNSHLLFRFKDENRHFDEMQRWTELPKDGFGTIEGVKNFQFTNIHFAVEKDQLNTELYIWTAEYGMAKYTITADKYCGTEDALKTITADNTDVKKVIVNGQMYIVRNGVVYTAMGQVAE